jgi:hypothetical protein
LSWDAYLYDERGELVAEWNYTHNTNPMIAEALKPLEPLYGPVPECGGPLGPVIGPAWWELLEGLDGSAGSGFLAALIVMLESDPERFRAMNPANGWGDYDRLLVVLREMRAAGSVMSGPRRRCWRWHVWG